jgi:DNA-binding NarL/FixJ family response regulator
MTKVYLVDDHRLFLAGVKAELSEEFVIVGSAYDVDSAIEEIRGLDPDVVLIDVHMPDGGGDAVFSPRLAGFVLDAFAGAMPSDEDPELDQLTTREKDVLRLIARGFAYKQVARKLNISIKTVETHVSSVLRKLQLSNRHELARWASKRRIV